MIEPFIALFAALAGYLLGSISFARIIGKIVVPNEDITQTEFSVPGNDAKVVMDRVSATSLSMRKGPKVGCTTSILDMVKIALPTLVLKLLFPDSPYYLISAAAGVAGHNWPLYHKFKGGSGLSAIFGGLVIIDFPAIIVTNGLGMLIGLLIFQDVMMAYLAGTLLLIPWFWWRTGDWWAMAYGIAVTVFLLLAMRSQLSQYIKYKREGKVPDLKTTLTITDMGKGFERMLVRMKRNKE